MLVMLAVFNLFVVRLVVSVTYFLFDVNEDARFLTCLLDVKLG